MIASSTADDHRRDEAADSWRRLPKVELHLHLDCCVDFATASRLAPGLTEREYRDEFVAPARCRNFAEWVTRVDPALALMQTADGLRAVTDGLLRQLAADGVVYAEIRFAPLLHLRDGLSPDDVVRVVEAAAREASRHTGVTVRLILCTLRHFDPADSLRTADLAAQWQGTMVAGFDLAGDEVAHPATPHAPAFALAAAAGLALTAHAGEGAGPASVREVLDIIGPARIGHGVRSAEDPDLVARLANHGVHLEVCPGSNVQIGVVASLADHPIDRLFAAGVNLGINTDARAVVDTTLSGEYAGLAAAKGWGPAEFARCNRNALAAAFLPQSERDRLAKRLVLPDEPASRPPA